MERKRIVAGGGVNDSADVKVVECPNCSRPGDKVIYYGLPFRLCPSEACSTLWGHWALEWISAALPFNGFFLKYEGSYARALWVWLTHG
jgi:hypothetical protein